MKLAIFILFLLIFVISGNVLLSSQTDTPQCSMNASTAYVDLILVIDTSANMGAENVRKISTILSLVLPKFTIGQKADVCYGQRNTRIAVVTFDSEAKIAANYTNINSVSDLNRIINGLSISSSYEANLYGGILKGFYIKTNCTSPDQCNFDYFMRPTAMIVFAADANSNSVNMVPDLVNKANILDDGTLVTVNFNSTNKNLTNLIRNITWVPWINEQMYNFSSNSNTLTKDLEWAILQANCYCGDILGFNTLSYDIINKRYTRNAECTG